MYRYLLFLHIISIISWMAGILYLLRLFVYHAQETEQVVKERFHTMETRLFRYITLPASIASLIFGFWMLALNPLLMKEPWMHAKILLVFILFGITHWSGSIIATFQAGNNQRSDRYYRVLNEVPTLLMIGIVYLVIVRPF